MQRLVSACVLLSHVIRHGLCVAMLSHRRDEVATRPERAAPQFLLDPRTAGEHLTRGQALDLLRELLRAVSRHALHQKADVVTKSGRGHRKVDVVTVGANLDEGDLVATRDLQTHLAQHRVHLFCSSITTRRHLVGHTR